MLLGEADGDNDGKELGWVVGPAVGMVDGNDDGVKLGLTLGLTLGDSDGTNEGNELGLLDGLTLGDSDGECEELGLLEGSFDGEDVGFAEGGATGNELGLTVTVGFGVSGGPLNPPPHTQLKELVPTRTNQVILKYFIHSANINLKILASDKGDLPCFVGYVAKVSVT